MQLNDASVIIPCLIRGALVIGNEYLELDLSRMDGSGDGLARLNISRAGYDREDDPENKHQEHLVEVRSAFGLEVINDRTPNNTLFSEELAGAYTGIYAGNMAVENDAYVLGGGGDGLFVVAKLVITCDDGSEKIITTNDREWKFYNAGPIIYSSLDLGEIYNATGWKQAQVVTLDGTTFSGEEREFGGEITRFDFDEMKLIGQIGNNAGVYTTLTARSMEEVRPGVYVYNMGQNMVGVPRITLNKGNPGEYRFEAGL